MRTGLVGQTPWACADGSTANVQPNVTAATVARLRRRKVLMRGVMVFLSVKTPLVLRALAVAVQVDNPKHTAVLTQPQAVVLRAFPMKKAAWPQRAGG